jgi:predicted transcriptional regulator
MDTLAERVDSNLHYHLLDAINTSAVVQFRDLAINRGKRKKKFGPPIPDRNENRRGQEVSDKTAKTGLGYV